MLNMVQFEQVVYFGCDKELVFFVTIVCDNSRTVTDIK